MCAASAPLSGSPGPWSIAVVLPVHAGVDAEHFTRALASIRQQSLPADEIVVVQDGPLEQGHLAALATLEQLPGLTRIELPRHAGIAAALNEGIRATSCRWIARMDSDDIALPGRLESQIAALKETGVDALGTAMTEFHGTPATVVGIRRGPTHHNAIARRMKTLNPVNHPTVVVRRSAVLSVGGYRPLAGLEDYDLWARMLASGFRFHNLPEPHLLFRGGETMLARRRARGVLAAEVQLQRNLREYGLIGAGRMGFNLVVRSGFRALPTKFMTRAYSLVFLSGHRRSGR